MGMDDRIESDLAAYARALARDLPPLDDTARALHARGRTRRSRLRAPLMIAAAAIVLVLLLPVPYTRQRGFDVRVDGNGTVTLLPHLERVWGPVLAMAREKFRIDVDLQAGRPEQIEAEIKRQLARQGWSADLVDVRRIGPVGVPQDDGSECILVPGTTLVTIDAHGEGQQLHLVLNRDRTSPWQRLTVRGATVEAIPMPSDDVMEKQIRDRLKGCQVEGADLEVKDGKIKLLVLH
jgi:hypothetical protein